MQALRVAAKSSLHTSIERGALCIRQGNLLLYESDALLRLAYSRWHWDTALRRGCLQNANSFILVLTQDRLVIENLALDLRRAEHALAARWIAKHAIAELERAWTACTALPRWYVFTSLGECKREWSKFQRDLANCDKLKRHAF
jgi:hypothetical protein